MIEEFLPLLITAEILPEIQGLEVEVGPMTTFSSVYFSSTLDNPISGGGVNIKTKNQDFSISKRLYIKASHNQDFSKSVTKSTVIAYVVAECKTNLDKTMFQEATATAHDVKTTVPGAKYFLLCEWLDMTPISTAPTDIDEVIILRKAKRMSSNKRKSFSSATGRENSREEYKHYLESNPIQYEMVLRFLDNIKNLLTRESLEEKDVIKDGYF